MKVSTPLGLVIVLSLIVAACRQDDGHGLLVAEYVTNSSTMFFKAKVRLPALEDRYRFSYELSSGDKVCTLSGELDIKEIPSEDECPGTKGQGKISCPGSKPMKIRWSMTSCQSGLGQSLGKSKAKFFFGYARNKERALDQLEKIKSGDE